MTDLPIHFIKKNKLGMNSYSSSKKDENKP